MMSEEAYPEAATILRDAGWKPHNPWGVYTRGTLVMGFSPDGQHFDVKNWGADVHGEDYPDDPVEAAQWLVRLRANPLQTEATLDPIALAQEPEQVETPGHESDGETGGGSDVSELGQDEPNNETPVLESAGDSPEQGEGDFPAEPDGLGASGPIDADFEAIEELGAEDDLLSDTDFDTLAIEGADVRLAEDSDYFIPRETEPPQDRFIGLDDLDRRRSLRIGDTIRYANSLMPAWSIEDDARLAYLRNFAMGVSEKRWDDNAANQAELNALETTIRRINEIKNARDAKVEFLEGASREEIEDFAVEADWP